MKQDRNDLTKLVAAANPAPEPDPAERPSAGPTDVLERILSLPVALGRAAPREPRLLTALAYVVLGITIGALTTAFTMAGSGERPEASPESLSTVSTQGKVVPLSPRSKRMLDFSRIGSPERSTPATTGQALLMAERGDTAFFRTLKNGDACFYTGRFNRKHDAYDLGSGGCWTPSPRSPIKDSSVIQAAGPGGFRVMTIEGFAADGVKTIAVTDMSGNVVTETRVTDNVYKITAYPPDRASAVLVLDEGRHVVFRWGYRPAGLPAGQDAMQRTGG